VQVLAAEALVVAGYAIFLAIAAAALEAIARHSHRRTQAIETTGFAYDRKRDLWTCPAGRPLHRAETIWERKAVRYRAQAHHCNACALKYRCTDSDEGRTIEHRAESRLQSGMLLFHRGLSAALLLLAVLILTIEIGRQNAFSGRLALGALAAVIGSSGVRLVASLHKTTS
jgi:hypothetical protein